MKKVAQEAVQVLQEGPKVTQEGLRALQEGSKVSQGGSNACRICNLPTTNHQIHYLWPPLNYFSPSHIVYTKKRNLWHRISLESKNN